MTVLDQQNFTNETQKTFKITRSVSPIQVASVCHEKSTNLIDHIDPDFIGTAKSSTAYKRRPFCSPTKPLEKLKVEVVESEVPCSIEPPSELSFILTDGTIAAASSLTNQNFANSAILTATAVPPELRRKMEDHENPFRPDGSLSFEVEPIVEEFKVKPYRQMSSPPPSSMGRSGAGSPTVYSKTTTTEYSATTGPATVPEVVPLGKTVALKSAASSPSENAAEPSPTSSSSKSGKKPSKTAKKPSDIKISPPYDQSDSSTAVVGQKNVGQVEHKMLVSPKAAQAEMVHLNDRDSMKKRKCRNCCACQ